MDYYTFNGRENRSNHAGTDDFSRNSQAAGAFMRFQQRGWKAAGVLMLKARPATPSVPPSCFSCCKLAVLSQDFSPPVPIPKKELVIRNNFKQSLQKSARCPQPAPKTIPRTAGAGASEFLVVKRQGARCLAQNNYKLHALLHFINLSWGSEMTLKHSRLHFIGRD